MNRWIKHSLVVLMTLCLLAVSRPADARTTHASQDTIQMSVELGSPENGFHFYPDTMQFKVGKQYKLTLSNPSPVKHYFTAKDFADVVWTRKVDVAGVEVKGKVSELELKPEAEADWVFVPQRAGEYSLKCIVPGHELAGMVGKLIVEDT
ncbi:MAG: plastocyanin/azurin family copper-binding protein [Cyanobacteria bacterium P01_A01_bin.3]